jgi:capsular polysaccharide transport system permease protein
LGWWNRSFEKFYLYYGKHVGVDYDPVSSITVLTARAFTAEDAHKINDLLLNISERLVNTLNDRSRRDLIGFADNEVKIASDKAKDASLALLSYRSSQEVFEPDKQAAIQLEGVAKIQQELIATEMELAQIRKLSPDNPQIGALNNRAASLRDAISAEAAKVTSSHGSFSARAPNFERLALDVQFADKQLGVALAELESARAEALQKQLYLERLVQPSLPDKAMEPKRARSVLIVFVLSLISWAVVSILIASVREHAD